MTDDPSWHYCLLLMNVHRPLACIYLGPCNAYPGRIRSTARNEHGEASAHRIARSDSRPIGAQRFGYGWADFAEAKQNLDVKVEGGRGGLTEYSYVTAEYLACSMSIGLKSNRKPDRHGLHEQALRLHQSPTADHSGTQQMLQLRFATRLTGWMTGSFFFL
jgi:hypothetical protein